jgi:hypothetical protein
MAAHRIAYRNSNINLTNYYPGLRRSALLARRPLMATVQSPAHSGIRVSFESYNSLTHAMTYVPFLPTRHLRMRERRRRIVPYPAFRPQTMHRITIMLVQQLQFSDGHYRCARDRMTYIPVSPGKRDFATKPYRLITASSVMGSWNFRCSETFPRRSAYVLYPPRYWGVGSDAPCPNCQQRGHVPEHQVSCRTVRIPSAKRCENRRWLLAHLEAVVVAL